jgi:hypothetical protein
VRRTLLIIIARGVPLTYATMQQNFAGHPRIDVVLDRRYAHRRQTVLTVGADRRKRERRSRHIDIPLRELGWGVVEEQHND